MEGDLMNSAIAFCNDIDYADWNAYKEVHRVFEEEFGIYTEDSFWLFDPNGSDMALFKNNISEKGPKHDELLEDIKSGRLTILHSAGNFSRMFTDKRPTRQLVQEGLEYLKQYAKVPIIWTNHGDEGDIQNIGGRVHTYQQGDLPGTEVYILDLLLQYGFKFFCTDTNLINEFVLSVDNTGKPLIEKVKTKSGYTINTFNRYRGPLPKAPDAETLWMQLSDNNLDSLIKGQGNTIIYQHWCVHRDSKGKPFTAEKPIFPKESYDALEKLAKLHSEGKLAIRKVMDLLLSIENEV